MDQEKIGALIASLRKKQVLTQSQLGAKVGVGDRAVSKWERGITCPDISIINELSSILGITSDELLKGELTKEHKEQLKEHKFNKKLLLLIPLALIIIAAVIIISNKNKTYVYTLISESNDYEITGTMTYQKGEARIIINNIRFINNDINKLIIKNYEYNIVTNNIMILRSGYINNSDLNIEAITVEEFMKPFKINYKNSINISNESIQQNGLIMTIIFLDINENIIEKEIKIKLN